jgi:Zn-finger nucleic acid-binding protein
VVGLRPLRASVDASLVAAKGRLYPYCSAVMGTIAYETSGVIIDKCSSCHGIWLDHGEFEKIVRHLEREVSSETAAQYCCDIKVVLVAITTLCAVRRGGLACRREQKTRAQTDSI